MGIWFFAFVFLELGQRMKEIYHMASCWYPYDSLQYLHLNFYSPDFCPLKYLIFNCCLNTEDMWQTEFYWSALVVVDTSLATPPCFFFLYPPPASFFLIFLLFHISSIQLLLLPLFLSPTFLHPQHVSNTLHALSYPCS